MIICKVCKDENDPAPSGDARNMWIGYHQSWYHKLWFKIKAKYGSR